MKKVLLLAIGAGLFLASTAQVKPGVKAGMNNSNFRGSDVEGNSSKVSFYVGGQVEIPVTKKLSMKPELVYSAQGAKQTYNGPDVKLKTSYINIPVMAKYQLIQGLYAETGPQFGILLGASMKYDGEKESMKEDFKTMDLSWGFGVGYMLPTGLGFNARYNLGLSKIGKEGDAKVFNGVLQLGVVYEFRAGKLLGLKI